MMCWLRCLRGCCRTLCASGFPVEALGIVQFRANGKDSGTTATVCRSSTTELSKSMFEIRDMVKAIRAGLPNIRSHDAPDHSPSSRPRPRCRLQEFSRGIYCPLGWKRLRQPLLRRTHQPHLTDHAVPKTDPLCRPAFIWTFASACGCCCASAAVRSLAWAFGMRYVA